MKINTVIAFMQTFGIILVVIGHSFFNALPNPIATWIYSFHMPLFFFISGFLFCSSCNKKKKGITDLKLLGRNGILYTKAKRLIIPYVVISSLVFCPKVILSNFAVRPINGSYEEYFRMLLYPYENVISFFWFLPTLYLVFVTFILMARFIKPSAALIVCLFFAHIVISISHTCILNIDGVIYYLPYFVLGYFMSNNNIILVIEKNSKYIAPISLLLSFVFCYGSFLLGFKTANFVCSLNGILMSYTLGCLYASGNYRFFNHLFGASFTIYQYSWFAQTLCFQFVYRITGIPFYVAVVLAIITGVYFPWFIYRWMKSDGNGKIKQTFRFMCGMK